MSVRRTRVDLTGQVFGDLTVLRWERVPSRRRNMWLCRCKCGNERHRYTNDLTSGKSTSCGCQAARNVAAARIIDRTGQRYGSLLVVSPAPDRVLASGKVRVRWNCRCDCGRSTVVDATSLGSGNTRSCGANIHRRRHVRRDLTGQVFENLTVVELADVDKPGLHWECRCECGSTVVRSTTQLNRYLGRCNYQCPAYFKPTNDIIGETFGSLTVIALVTDRRTPSGVYIYRCLCECGREVERPRSSLTAKHTLSCGCKRKAEVGRRWVDPSTGYAYVFQPGHPGVKRRGWMLEHRFVVAELLGRPLLTNENVHHRNGVRHDNSTDGPLQADPVSGRLYSGNLELWSTKQPMGQRPGDKVRYAREILALYGKWFPPPVAERNIA